MGSTSATLDSKGNYLNYVYVRGSDLSLAGPLRRFKIFYSGSFRTNDYEFTSRYFNVNQTSNTSLTMDLGTSTITIEYEMEWTTFDHGNYSTNVSSATILLKEGHSMIMEFTMGRNKGIRESTMEW